MLYPKPEPREKIPKFRFSPNPNRAYEIRWNDWTQNIFDRAREEKKPILLAIAAVWCHWCHVMDETSYSDERNIRLINENYIPIRVDADKRPDIQDRYLLGGWPTTAILTSTGEIITGGTYIPPGQFHRFLRTTGDYYQKNREKIEEDALQKRNQIIEMQAAAIPAYREINRRIPSEVVKSLHRSFDSVYGGFSAEPKFPNPLAIELLLRRAFLENETYLLEMATITLDHMANGEINDEVWGGFFRYATERDWTKPHYEKLLADNANHIINYLHAYQVAELIKYRDTAEKTLSYVDNFFANKDSGGFSGSQDADEKFYKLSEKERLRGKIPYIDPIIYTDANAQMISAYIEAYKVLGDRNYLEFAKRTTNFLIANCYSPNMGMAHYYDNKPHFHGWLADQANMIGSLIDLYNVLGEFSYLNTAKQLVEICKKSFADDTGSAFFDRSSNSDEPELGALIIKNKPVQGNALMARHIHRLAYLDTDNGYEKMAGLVLSNIQPDLTAPTPENSLYGLAVDEVITQPVILTVIGDKNEPGAQALLSEAWRQYIPGKEVKPLDPVKDYDVIEKSGFPVERHPIIYPCIGRMCLPAVDTIREFKTIIENLPGRPK